MSEIALIIDRVPVILQFFVPGYIGAFCFKYVTTRKYQSKAFVIASCVISYILMSVCKFIAQLFPDGSLISEWPLQVIISSAVSAILGILLGWLVHATWFSNILSLLFGMSPMDDVLEDTLDAKGGVNVRVFFKSDKGYSIYGHYKSRDVNKDDGWILITGYMKIDKNGGEFGPVDSDVGYLCRLSDIDYMIVE